jgi:hypothetical protein
MGVEEGKIILILVGQMVFVVEVVVGLLATEQVMLEWLVQLLTVELGVAQEQLETLEQQEQMFGLLMEVVVDMGLEELGVLLQLEMEVQILLEMVEMETVVEVVVEHMEMPVCLKYFLVLVVAAVDLEH